MKKIILILSVLFMCLNVQAQTGSWFQLEMADHEFENDGVSSMAIDHNGNIYAAGAFKNNDGYYYVARWNGSAWIEVGTGTNALKANGDIKSIIIDNNNHIYAAGSFSNGTEPTLGKRYVAKWDGTSWSELGFGENALNANSSIFCLAMDVSGNIYAGGLFSDENGKVYIAKWNGSTWSALGIGIYALNGNYSINTITSDLTGNVYVGGYIRDSNYNYNIIKWNGSAWSSIGVFNGPVFALHIDKNGILYAGGQFTNTLNTRRYVAKWNGINWSAASNFTIGGSVFAITSDKEGYVYVAGDALLDVDNGNNFVARIDGNSWSKLGDDDHGLMANGPVFTLVADASENVYAGGAFSNTNKLGYVGKWTYGTVTGVREYTSHAAISMYPNPSTGIVQLDVPEEGELNIFNVLGEKIITKKIAAGISSVDLEQAVAGFYNVVFISKETSYLPAKLVIE